MANHVPRQEQLDDQKILEETETTKDISLMKELTKLYQQRIEDLNSLNQDGSSNELKIQVLETAIRDLGDLNVMLVDTVNQLEREAVKHVKIFERHLLKSSSAAEKYMSQIETINSVAKETARDLRRSKEEELCVQSQLDGATALNMLQVEEISDLKKDLNNLIELLRRVRKEGSWKVDDLEFNTVSLLEILGTNTLPVPEKSSHTEFPSSQPTFSTAVPEQNVFGYENLHIDQLTAELVTLRCAQEEAAMFASVREEEIHQLNEEIAILKEEMVMKDDELEILKRQFGESFSDYENLPSSSNTDTFQFCTIDDSEVKHESSVWKDRALALESEILQVQFEIKKGKEETLELEHQMNLLKIQMEELQEKLLSTTKERDSSIAELETNKKELDYSTKEINALKQELKEMDSSSRDVRAALTAEVAEKHDKILVLKRENQIIEEQLREASMQTHFKDDILKEMRKDLKILRARLLSVDPASEEFVSNGLRYISKSSSLPMHLEETVKDDKITQCLSEDFPAVNEPRKETVLEKPSSSADVTLSADSRKNSYKSNLTPEKLKTSRLLASGNQNFTTHPHKPQTNHNYGGMGDIPTNNNVSSTKDVFSYSGGESKVRLRQVGRKKDSD